MPDDAEILKTRTGLQDPCQTRAQVADPTRLTAATELRYAVSMISAVEALVQLRDGNERFVSDVRSMASMANSPRRGKPQTPFAIVLGCADARVPSEIVFDQGLGDLFVIRVVGNIVAPSQVGSVEYAAAHLGARLVVVLGHSQCGAIAATMESIRSGTQNPSSYLRFIIDRVRPSVEELLATELAKDDAALGAHAIRANVRASANHLRHGSALLENLLLNDGLLVVGAEYHLDTGKVDFFDGVPPGVLQAGS